jgi:hypothetical protein
MARSHQVAGTWPPVDGSIPRGAQAMTEHPHVALRRQRLRTFVDLSSGVGLEIGPLDAPVATKPSCDVRYVDVLDTAALREHFRGDPKVDLEGIVTVDFPLTCEGKVRTLAEAAGTCAPYRWVVASHVVEHVPDLVGWLSDVAAILENDGLLLLVVPDRRFSFDAVRPPTTVGQLLEAHSRLDTAPSERAVYDHFRSSVEISAEALWAGAPAKDAQRMCSLEDAMSMREAALRGEYIDSHVWVFSPTEFVSQLAELGELDLMDFTVDHVQPTAPNELEFYALLRRLPRDATTERGTEMRRAAFPKLDAELARFAQEPDLPGDQRETMELSALEARLIRAKRFVMRRVRALRLSAT